MPDPAHQITAHMTVVGSDGLHIGTVDHMRDGRIKLSRNDDPDGGHHHHSLSLDMVAAVEHDMVKLNLPAQEARGRAMRDEA